MVLEKEQAKGAVQEALKGYEYLCLMIPPDYPNVITLSDCKADMIHETLKSTAELMARASVHMFTLAPVDKYPPNHEFVGELRRIFLHLEAENKLDDIFGLIQDEHLEQFRDNPQELISFFRARLKEVTNATDATA